MYIECDMLVIRQLKKLHFNFDLPIDVDKNLKHENKFTIKRDESLSEYEIKKRVWPIIVQK